MFDKIHYWVLHIQTINDHHNQGKMWVAVEWILRYLRGTSNTCLYFGTNKPMLIGCTNADMVGDVDSIKSASGYLITFSRGAMSWQSRL